MQALTARLRPVYRCHAGACGQRGPDAGSHLVIRWGVGSPGRCAVGRPDADADLFHAGLQAPIPSRLPTGICTCRAALGSAPRSVSSLGWPATRAAALLRLTYRATRRFVCHDQQSAAAPVSGVTSNTAAAQPCVDLPPAAAATTVQIPLSSFAQAESCAPRPAERARDRHLRQPHHRPGRDDDPRSALPAQQ